MHKKTYANHEVLNFYRSLPFNRRAGIEEEIRAVSEMRINRLYPGLAEILAPAVSVLEFGCGVGWLSNSINFLYHCPVVGIDFNPVAINVAKKVATQMKLTTKFFAEDLFLYNPDSSFDLVISFGVLHHTNDCQFAVKLICEKFVRPGGYVIIGLYHKYGRRPFLDHFNKMKTEGATQNQLFARYRELQSYIKDEALLFSWFRDQVLNPHETQHTLEEMLPLLEEADMELISTSINHFKPIKSFEDLCSEEKKYTLISENHLKNNRYFPGFFIFLARKRQY